MPIKIQLRRGTAAQWTSANPILATGEFGYETDTAKFKIGSGTASWSLLSYASSDLSAATASATYATQSSYAPFGRNLIINGAMQVAQRGTSSTGITANGYYTADRWQMEVSTLGTWTQTIETDAPTGSGFNKSLKVLCTTANASPGTNAYATVRQIFEGQDLQRLKKGTSSAEQLTISFWVKSNVTGTYICWLFDANNTRSTSISYTINQSATWEKKTITFAADTVGALNNDNAAAFRAYFLLGAGSAWQSGTLATTWQTYTLANTGVGQTNLAAATNNYWQITGVQLETGPVATPFEFEPYETTLRKCQRYYYRISAESNYSSLTSFGSGRSTTVVGAISIPLKVSLRAAPSSVEFSNVGLADTVGISSVSAMALEHSNINYVTVNATSSGLTQYRPYYLSANNNTSAYIAINAEL